MLIHKIKQQVTIKRHASIIQNMLHQRSGMINTCEKDLPLHDTLAYIKDSIVPQNRIIRHYIYSQIEKKAKIDLAGIAQHLKGLDGLFAQSKLPKNVTLYRGTGAKDFGFAHLKSKDFIKMFFKRGRIFTIPIFPETTLDRKIAEKYAKDKILFIINAYKNAPAIFMENLEKSRYHAKSIDEREIMVGRNLLYRFKNHIEIPNFDILEIDMVKRKPFWKKIHKFWEEI